MAYEIDFLAVGENSNSGDAICLRYGSAATGYRIHIVDGGFQECGDKVVTHLTNYYDAPVHIDHVVLTHADNDHAGGLIKVLETYSVGTLWMNRPWLHAAEIVDLFKYDWTVNGLRKKLQELYPSLIRLEEVAYKKGIPINDVFQGVWIGNFHVLAPSKSRYLSLIPHFDKTPLAKTGQSLLGSVFGTALRSLKETWTGETLSESPDPTSASNESSVVQIGFLDNRQVLLAADVGPEGLKEAAKYAAGLLGVNSPKLAFAQVPHHGSRRNVTPSVLNWWLGQPLKSQSEMPRGVAFCSTAAKDKDHPRKKVVNAFTRRGYPVHVTNGQHKCHRHETPSRSGWTDSPPHPFTAEVEE